LQYRSFLAGPTVYQQEEQLVLRGERRCRSLSLYLRSVTIDVPTASAVCHCTTSLWDIRVGGLKTLAVPKTWLIPFRS